MYLEKGRRLCQHHILEDAGPEEKRSLEVAVPGLRKPLPGACEWGPSALCLGVAVGGL